MQKGLTKKWAKKQVARNKKAIQSKVEPKGSSKRTPKFCQYSKESCAFPECGCNKIPQRLKKLNNGKISHNTTKLNGVNRDKLFKNEARKLSVQEHYRGMPEYVQKDLKAYRKVVVHLADEDAVRKFFKLIGQSYTEKTNSVQFPEGGEDKYMDKRYSDKKKK